MSACQKLNRTGLMMQIFLGISALLFSSLACDLPSTTSEVQGIPTTPADMPPVLTAPTATPVQEVEAPTPAAELVSLEQGILGFWRTKVAGKEILVFEFKGGGKTTWYYHYSNGQTRNVEGSYSVKDSVLTVDMGGPQDLKADLAGDQLTITGPDDKPMLFLKVQSADSPSPSASKNVAQDITGKWQDPKTQEWIEFKPDGSVSITNGSNTVAGTYSVTGSQLEMKLNDQGQQPSTFTVEIVDNNLTLYGSDGSFIDYIR